MGIDIYCGEKTFGTSYSDWGEVRSNIIKATIDYILDKFDKDQELYKNIEEYDDNWIGKGSSYYCYMNNLCDLKEKLLDTNQIKSVFGITIDNTLNNFINLCNNLKYVNSLNYFEIGGLYALCNQSDCDGYYTPGNSLDICRLFDQIKPFMQKYYGYYYIYVEEGRVYNTVYSVFENSYMNTQKVRIS
jgi:hypothetical protein